MEQIHQSSQTFDAAGWLLERKPAPRLMRGVARLWLACAYELRRRLRRSETVVEHVDGLEITVLPGVFNPRLFRSGVALARSLRMMGVDESTHVLDMGTGSGIGAAFAARLGAAVIAVDLNPAAVRCAALNAQRLAIADRIDIRTGDLFVPVAGEIFDLVLFNPPYYSGVPTEPWELAWRSEDVFDRFLAGLPEVLSPGGRGLVVLSTDARGPLEALVNSGMDTRVVWQHNYVNEIIAVLEIDPDNERSVESGEISIVGVM